MSREAVKSITATSSDGRTLPHRRSAHSHARGLREDRRVVLRILVQDEEISGTALNEAGVTEVALAHPRRGIDREQGGRAPLEPQVKLADNRPMSLVAARVGSHEEKDARVDEHLEVGAPRVVHGLHRRRVDGVLRPRLGCKVFEELDLAQRRRHRYAACGNLAGLIRIDTAAVFDVVNAGLNERVDDAV